MSGYPIQSYQMTPAFDPNDRYGGQNGQGIVPDQLSLTNPLDSDENLHLLKKLQGWWNECREIHAPNRAEQLIDADFKDGDQWSAQDAEKLAERGQAPLAHNFVGQMVNWLTGTERRTRVDWDVVPRRDGGQEMADAKKQLLKYVGDVNRAAWERSAAFDDCATVGVGWVEDCLNLDQFEEPLTCRHESWKNMWWDPYSRNPVMKDCRYMTRAKYLDLDYGAAMFPDRVDRLRHAAVNFLDPGLEMLEVDNSLPQVFYSTTQHSTLFQTGTQIRNNRYTRQRVLGLETWFRKPMTVKFIRDMASDLDGAIYDPNNPEHNELTHLGTINLCDGVSQTLWCALWTPGALLRVMPSPYRHNRFPFTPCFAYRRHRDYMPYGIVRNARAGQEEYNKRRSKALFLLSVNRVIYEDGVFDEEDEETMLDECLRPDARIRVAKDALKDDRFRIEAGGELVESQLKMMESAKDNIYEQGGVTRENMGGPSNAIAGVAIDKKQTQGAVTTATLFDNYRLFYVESGQKQLSNIEQYMTMPKEFRILGENGAIDFAKINQPVYDPATGRVVFENDITADEADFVVDTVDYRETIRQAETAVLFDMISKMPPEVALPMLSEALNLTDLPNKNKLVAIAQKAAGIAPDPSSMTPEEQQAAAQQAQDEQQAKDLDTAQKKATLQLTSSRASEADARAAAALANAGSTNVGTKSKAIETAASLHKNAALAPSADAIMAKPPKEDPPFAPSPPVGPSAVLSPLPPQSPSTPPAEPALPQPQDASPL